ncbi:MAG: hypothetical protein JWM64_197 [Frankiales bacterium]|nr:hypothetical protein [Frankiales bacterium]
MKKLLLAATAVVVVAASTPALAAPAPARVTGASFALGVLQTGNDAGLPLVYGLGTSTVFLVVPPGSLPEPGRGVVLQASAAGGDVLAQLQSAGRQGIVQGRTGVAPLAVLNGPANTGVETLASVLDFLGKDLGDYTGPFNVTLTEMAAIARTAEEPAD